MPAEGWSGRGPVAYWATWFFTLAMYASLANLLPALSPLRPALLSSCIAALALLSGLLRRERIWIGGPRGLALLGFALWALASIRWSVFPAETRHWAIELLKQCLFYLLLINVVTDARRLRLMLVASMLGGLGPAWGSLQNYLHKTRLVEGFRARWEGIYEDPNHMAMAMVFLVPVGVTFALRAPRRWERALGALSVAASCTCIVVSHSRGGFLGLALAMVLWAARERRRLRAFAALAVVFGGLVVAAPESFWSRNETLTEYHQDLSALGRVRAWEVAAAINQARPILGVGYDGFAYAWPIYAPADDRGEALVAHNIFLEVLGDLGYVGLFLFLGFLGASLGGGHEACRAPLAGPWVRAVFAGGWGYICCEMSSGYIKSDHFFLICSLLTAAQRIAWLERAPAAEPEPGLELALSPGR